jgi:hypothetical protein
MKKICKVCKEEDELWTDGMCNICHTWLWNRLMRATKDSLKKAGIFEDKK